jgi:hypothetical protein
VVCSFYQHVTDVIAILLCNRLGEKNDCGMRSGVLSSKIGVKNMGYLLSVSDTRSVDRQGHQVGMSERWSHAREV